METCVILVPGRLDADGQGVCHILPDGDTVGVHPTSINQWAILEHTVANDYKGIGLRLLAGSGNPSSSVYNYAARCSGNDIFEIRNCIEDDGCATIASGGTCEQGDGDQFAFAVTGEGDATELCTWWWDSTVELSDADAADPETWGNADFCTTSGTNPVTITMDIAETPAATEGWDKDEPGFAGPEELHGWPADTQKDIAPYSGTETSWDINWFMGGEL
jgi:hypothetical protein